MSVTILFLFLLPLFFIIPVLVGIYVYRDAKKRGMNAVLWLLISLLAPSLLGFIIYLLVRNNYSDLKCPNCDTRVEESFIVCPNCRTKLRPTCPSCSATVQTTWKVCPHCDETLSAYSGDVAAPVRSKDKTLWKILIAILIIPTVVIFLMIAAITAFSFNNGGYLYSSGLAAIPVEEYLKECDYREVVEDFIFSDNGTAYKVMQLNEDDLAPDQCKYLIYIPGARGYVDYTTELEAKHWFSDDYYLELDILCNNTGEELIFEFTYQTSECPDELFVLYNGRKADIHRAEYN